MDKINETLSDGTPVKTGSEVQLLNSIEKLILLSYNKELKKLKYKYPNGIEDVSDISTFKKYENPANKHKIFHM